MGTQLVAQVTTIATRPEVRALSTETYACLLVMAHVARDQNTAEHEARVYFAGWQFLAQNALRRPPPYTLADKQAVGRCMRQLVDAGLIKPDGRLAGRQSKVIYRLTI